MAEILKKEKINEILANYFEKHYGERDSVSWYEQPAVNVWVFGKGEDIIALQCQMLTGEVTEHFYKKKA